MILKELFKKEIDRHINAAVVVSEMDNNSVKQEIEEYIFTNDIISNLNKFLNAITQAKKSKTGVWINGYYGSGKSHFIKYLFYCLNQDYRSNAIQRYLSAVKEMNKVESLPEVTLSNAQQIVNKLDKFEIDEIIFNIDAVSRKKNMQQVITDVLFNQFNKFRGYNNADITLALLIEKHLDKKDLFKIFQEKFEVAFNDPWKGNEIRVIQQSLSQVINIVKSLDDSIDSMAIARKLGG